MVSFGDHSSKNSRQSVKQNHVGIIEMPDFSARVKHMDQTDKWSLDPSAVNSELQQQNSSEQIPGWLFKNGTNSSSWEL